MERVTMVVACKDMHQDDEEPGPFGLTPAEVLAAFERTQGRPVGRPRYEAFARELEAAAVQRWIDVDACAFPLANAYTRLLHHARILRACLGQSLGYIQKRVPGADIQPGAQRCRDFDAEFPRGVD